ncbi:MAG: hypothetical protein R8M45_07395 [Ghiorsea sp.]
MLAASHENMEGLDLLTANSTAMNTPKNMPKPTNWSGVSAGMDFAKQAIANKDLTLAEHYLREVIEFAPAQTEAWHILAAILNRKGKLDEARDCLRHTHKLKKAHEAPPQPLPASRRMAKIMWAQGEHESALAMLDSLLLTSPNEELLLLQKQWQQQGSSIDE